MLSNGLTENLENRGGALMTLFAGYFGGASLAGKIDLTQLLSTAISGLIAGGFWLLIAWLKHRWENKRRGHSQNGKELE